MLLASANLWLEREAAKNVLQPLSQPVGGEEHHMNGTRQVNIFTMYGQMENHFTNGLISILRLATLHDSRFIHLFLGSLLKIDICDSFELFQVLEGYDEKSTADAVLKGESAIVQFETKIKSATLRKEQIMKHLDTFKGCSQTEQHLVMLTPDDSRSSYVNKFLDLDPARVQHLEWRKVFSFLFNYQTNSIVLQSIISQYLETIETVIFERDIIGIIAKVSFGEKSGVDADKYLDQMRNGKWTEWNTPRQYKSLDGTGRKLLLYDKNLRAITLEVEIAEVERTNQEVDYPWTNRFAPNTLRVFTMPIPVAMIEILDGFANFVHERAPYRNITHEQYSKLMSKSDSLQQITPADGL